MGKNQTTQTNTNEPYAGAKPLIDTALADFLKMYQGGTLPGPNTMSTVVPFARQTTNGMNDIERNSQNAMNRNPMAGAIDAFGGSYGRDGFNAGQRSAMGGMTNFANGSGNVGTGSIDQFGRMATRSPAMNGGMGGQRPGRPPVGGNSPWGPGGDFQGRGNIIDDLPQTGGGTPNPWGNGGVVGDFGPGGNIIDDLPNSDFHGNGNIIDDIGSDWTDTRPPGERGPWDGGGGDFRNNTIDLAPSPGGWSLPPGVTLPPPDPNPFTGGGGGGQSGSVSSWMNGGGSQPDWWSGGGMPAMGSQGQTSNPGFGGYTGFANGNGDISSSMQQQLAGEGSVNPALSGFSGLSEQQGPSLAEQNLMKVANGEYLNGGDPYFERMLGRATEDTSNAVQQAAAGMGRTGSGTEQAVLAREIGNLQNTARSGQYNQERANQVGAVGQIDAERSNAFGNRLAALGGYGALAGAGQDRALNAANSATAIQSGNQDRRMAGVAGQSGVYSTGVGQGLQAAGMSADIQGRNADRQMSALGQQFGMGQTGMDNIANSGGVWESLLNGQNAAARNSIGVGSLYEDLAGRYLNDKLRITQDARETPLRNIQALLAAASGAGQYSTGYQTAQGPNNTFSNLIGSGIGGASLLRSLFGA